MNVNLWLHSRTKYLKLESFQSKLSRYVRVIIPLICLCAEPAIAGTGDVRVDMDLTSGLTPTFSLNGQKSLSLADKGVSPIVLPSGRKAEFWVNDYNPILFKYNASTSTTQIDSVTAIQSFESVVKGSPFGGLTKQAESATIKSFSANQTVPSVNQKKGKKQNIPASVCVVDLSSIEVNNINIETLRNRLGIMQNIIKSKIPSYVSGLLNLANPELRTKALKYSDELQSLLGPDNNLVTGNADVNALDSELKELYDLRGINYKDEIKVTYKDQCGKSFSESFSSFTEFEMKAPDDLKLSVTWVHQVAQDAGDLRNGIALVKKFSDLLPSVGQPWILTSDDQQADSNVAVKITVAANEDLSPLVDGVKDKVSKRTGKYMMTVAPHQSWHVAISAAVIYSFVKNPQYSVQSNTSGTLVINQTSNDFNKASGAVSLNLIPDKWYGEYIEPHIQVGMVPDSSKPGFLLGLGFTAGTTLDFNMGAIYQKATVLGSGLTEGQTVTTTQALKTDTQYRSGLYIGVGVKLK